MQGKTLNWVVALMGLSMIGLIGFQLYWINDLVGANEERFRKDVLSALSNVANKLERQEAIAAFQKFNYLNSSVHETKSQDPVHEKIREQIVPVSKYDIIYQEGREVVMWFDTVELGNNFQFIVNFTKETSGFYNETPHEQISEELRMRDEEIRTLEDRLARVSRKYEMTVDVVQDLMSPKRTLMSRFHPDQLDSLLKNELKNKGINIGFNYGVYATHLEQFVLLTNDSEDDFLHENALRASLFPNDILGAQGNIIVDFPDKQNFLFSKIWSSLISSGVLVSVILFCFGYSIHTILKQKKLSEMKNDFINNMTHELKTPISTVSLAVEVLNDKEIENDKLRDKYLHVIGEENRRLGDQVEKVLQIAAIDRRDYNLEEEELNMSEMVREASDHIAMQIEQRGGRLNVIENAKENLIRGDRTHISNIILNLLDNANKYSPDVPNITLRTESDRQQFNFFVHDKGIGMTKDQLKYIFQKFYRVPTGDVHDVKGFGLGLSYVHKIVQAHHGKIHVDSYPKKGSIFSISLPLIKEIS